MASMKVDIADIAIGCYWAQYWDMQDSSLLQDQYLLDTGIWRIMGEKMILMDIHGFTLW